MVVVQLKLVFKKRARALEKTLCYVSLHTLESTSICSRAVGRARPRLLFAKKIIRCILVSTRPALSFAEKNIRYTSIDRQIVIL